MNVIWKEKLFLGRTQEIALPKGSKIIHAREQFEYPMIWYECDPTVTKEPRLIHIVGTGQEVPPNSTYLGTAIMQSGQFIVHIYEGVFL